MLGEKAGSYMSDEQDDGTLRDSEIALMDAIISMFEVIVAKGLSKPETLAKMLQMQSKAYSPEHMPRAVYVLEQIQASLLDPNRKQLRELYDRPPEGRS